MDYKKTTSRALTIALFLGLMTNLSGCEIGDTEGSEGGEEGVNTEQQSPKTDEGGEGGEGGEED
ncbi:hypothetical protein I4641_01005 [Waterburya agarophytonicola K14]|uniref:Uncharacterized protein n=1 Tax=Waterburya agarophytonicola KI4 TaxID=2874699 RepID=A0A964FFJ6_9CYAN|nr:hypothetical protein [Waterburya agarophytonicola]MCC0175558.1 hypothetical protein [Waterburya agarophytonicola KI4]